MLAEETGCDESDATGKRDKDKLSFPPRRLDELRYVVRIRGKILKVGDAFSTKGELCTRVSEDAEMQGRTWGYLSNYTGEGRPFVAICSCGRHAPPSRTQNGGDSQGATDSSRCDAVAGDCSINVSTQGDATCSASCSTPQAQVNVNVKSGQIQNHDDRMAVAGKRWLDHEIAVDSGRTCAFYVMARRTTRASRKGKLHFRAQR
jgi:hypothetical protein